MPRYLPPGTYVEEIRTPPPPILAAATDVAGFVGRCARGPVGEPLLVHNAADFARLFGDPGWSGSHLPASVALFFANGGQRAVVLRHYRPSTGDGLARLGIAGLELRAATPGAWGNGLGAELRPESPPGRFSLVLTMGSEVEQYQGLTLAPEDPRRLDLVLARESHLARVEGALPAGLDAMTGTATASGGDDGLPLEATDYVGAEGDAPLLRPLETGPPVNQLCLPPCRPAEELPAGAVAAAQDWCRDHGALLLVDPPLAWSGLTAALAGQESLAPRSGDSAVYLPRLLVAGQPTALVPCGAVAGVIARTDASRGVWQAPAGVQAKVRGVLRLAMSFSKPAQDQLAPAGINLLRAEPPRGLLVWGGRTRAPGPEQRYVNLRRTLLMIERSLRQGLTWAVFEPNGEALWQTLRARVDDFLLRLWHHGALKGQSPPEAYFVRCDGTTMTVADREAGRLICELGVALLRPAEFVVLRVELPSGGASPPVA